MVSHVCAPDHAGVVVLPCGAGKTLTGIMAAVTIKKATLILCVNTLSVEQWREQFMQYTTIDFADIHMLTSGSRPPPSGLGPRPGRNGEPARATVVVTTYPMIAYGGKRSAVASRAMAELQRVEWGLLILDEVHQAPANSFRKVISACPSHAKLGLTGPIAQTLDSLFGSCNLAVHSGCVNVRAVLPPAPYSRENVK